MPTAVSERVPGLGVEPPFDTPAPASVLWAAAQRARSTGDALHTAVALLLDGVMSSCRDADHEECNSWCTPETCDLSAALVVARQVLGAKVISVGAPSDELTVEKARDLADQLGIDLCRAQDALALAPLLEGSGEVSPARTVEVVWYYREPRGGPRQHETAERKTDVVLLETYADDHNMSPDVFSEVRRSLAVKYFGESLTGNNIFADSITSFCNCESAEACEYAEFDGRRFSLSDGSRIGSMTIRENVPNPHEGYPNSRLGVENVNTELAELTLAAIVEQEGHR